MRMGMGLLFGILVILFGLGIIINVVFHVNIPVFKVLVGVFIIYLGLKVILGDGFNFRGMNWNHGHDAVFNNRTYNGISDNRKEYNAVFGKAVVDLRGVTLNEKVTRIKVTAVFGGAEVILDKDMPFRIKAEAVFGGVNMPENSAGAFGTSSYSSKNFDEGSNYLLIDCESVFGGVDIHY
jgi:predicted membrane protein